MCWHHKNGVFYRTSTLSCITSAPPPHALVHVCTTVCCISTRWKSVHLNEPDITSSNPGVVIKPRLKEWVTHPLIPSCRWGGKAKFTASVAQWLSERGFDPPAAWRRKCGNSTSRLPYQAISTTRTRHFSHDAFSLKTPWPWISWGIKGHSWFLYVVRPCFTGIVKVGF